ncbi:MAG TPA: hypothetical protein VK435_01095 [Thermodesulfovibrionales bacterium]|nr:hypothetical protein [Thermodesulfovibrionales bacterium]
MHFIVSWEIEPGCNRQDTINNAMLGALGGHSWIRLLSSFYVIEIEYDSDWSVIHNNLLSIAERFSGKVNFLMSPIYDQDSEFFVYQMPEKGYFRT